MQWCVQPLDFQIFLTRLFLTSKCIPLNSHIQKSQVRLCLNSLNIPGQNDHSCARAIDRQSASVEAVDDSSIHPVLDHELPHSRTLASRDDQPIHQVDFVGETDETDLHPEELRHVSVFPKVALKSE